MMTKEEFFDAVMFNDINRVISYLSHGGDWSGTATRFGLNRTALGMALQFNNVYLADLFIENGADIVSTGVENIPAATLAVRFYSRDPYLLLKLMPKNPDYPNDNPIANAHLIYAVSQRDLHETQKTIQMGGNVHARDKDGNTPLFYATLSGHHKMIYALLKAGADINARNNNKDTPLTYALKHGRTPMANMLVQHRADLFLKNNQGESALDIIRQRGFPPERLKPFYERLNALTKTTIKKYTHPLNRSESRQRDS